jgi:hypothetical protein
MTIPIFRVSRSDHRQVSAAGRGLSMRIRAELARAEPPRKLL